jgi:SAM-dependent methyltransferase
MGGGVGWGRGPGRHGRDVWPEWRGRVGGGGVGWSGVDGRHGHGRGRARHGREGDTAAGRCHTEEMTQDGLATSFGAAAEQYERGRPLYPDLAVGWVLPPGAARVLDLGAGTGKLTRQLRGRGLEVIAVEPSAGMRETLRRAVPGVSVLAGAAERIPLADRCVDAVVVAQAWHWVDPARAVPEVARVLRPGGWLGLLWNLRDERTGWVARLSRLMGVREGPGGDTTEPVVGAPFGPVERRELEWVFHLSRGALPDYVASRSYVIALPPDRRADMLAAVGELASEAALTDDGQLAMPQITRCYRAALTG